MRKMMAVMIFILLILGLCSCKADETKTGEADNKENYREHQELTAFQTSFDADNMLRVSIPEANLNNVFIRETSANELLDNDIYTGRFIFWLMTVTEATAERRIIIWWW